MRYTCTIVGGLLGLATRRPPLVLFGLAIGFAFDLYRARSSRHRYQSMPDPGSEPRAPLKQNVNLPGDVGSAFFVCTFSMLAKLAQADGTVSREEMRTVREHIEEYLRLDDTKKRLALEIFDDALSSPLSFRDYAEKFASAYPDRVQVLDAMIDVLLQLAASDGRLSPSEDKLIRSAALIFDLSEPHYNRLKAQYSLEASPDDSSAYEVLGCSAESTDEEITRSYRKLINAYHPQRGRDAGVPEEFSGVAEQKIRRIEEAYSRIRKARNLDDLSA